MNSRRLIAAQRSGQSIVTVQTRLVKGRPDVRFGSKADMCSAQAHVRFTPKSGHSQARESERCPDLQAEGSVLAVQLLTPAVQLESFSCRWAMLLGC
jgi:hypothetical protein